MAELAKELRSTLLSAGAALVGFADMRQVPAESRYDLPRAVSIAVALDPVIVAAIRNGPTEDYVGEYYRRNEQLARLGQLATSLIEAQGYRALTWPPSQAGVDDSTLSTVLPHKTAATRSGMGWIGRCAAVVTVAFGSAIRLTTVLTDAPLPVGTPLDESHCGSCRVCADRCPAQAVSGQEWSLGMERNQLLDAFACRETAKRLGEARDLSYHICGRCIALCSKTEAYLRRAGALG
jgi:epoxyqueuosine reductase QueG